MSNWLLLVADGMRIALKDLLREQSVARPRQVPVGYAATVNSCSRSHPMKSALLVLGAAFLLSRPDYLVFAANAAVPLRPIRGKVIINRTTAAWESQQV